MTTVYCVRRGVGGKPILLSSDPFEKSDTAGDAKKVFKFLVESIPYETLVWVRFLLRKFNRKHMNDPRGVDEWLNSIKFPEEKPYGF